jgi:hypothetical protein
VSTAAIEQLSLKTHNDNVAPGAERQTNPGATPSKRKGGQPMTDATGSPRVYAPTQLVMFPSGVSWTVRPS